ncbi:DUF3048 domain-containing protein [Candidatus Parcubacteria bacterium]|nr:MAG: DUF3048 domain-containing protein [Candidatus Parcubacteria bacterium]
MDKRKIKIIVTGTLIYLISTIISYFIFSGQVLSQTQSPTFSTPVVETKKDQSGRVVFEDKTPKTESCPLNGALYSKKQKDWWESHRPLGVMIENHQESRPQSGLSYADVVYEAVAEGGITRFLTVFYCQDAGIIGPVRSARTYFLDFISEYGNNPLYAHVGGANTPGPADALSQIEKYGWQNHNDLNQFSIDFPTFWRDYERMGRTVATEHTMYSATEKLWAKAKERGLTQIDEDQVKWDEEFVPYKFKEDTSLDKRPENQIINFEFWSKHKDYIVDWNYDKATNSYLRENGGEKHLDKNNNQQLSAKNIIFVFMRESNANDGYEKNLHLLYGTKGTGKAVVFQDGKEIEGTWSKKSRTDHLYIYDKAGNEIKLNRGKIWFKIAPTGNDIVVK